MRSARELFELLLMGLQRSAVGWCRDIVETIIEVRHRPAFLSQHRDDVVDR